MDYGIAFEDETVEEKKPLIRPDVKNIQEDNGKDILGFGCRHTLAFMAFLGFVSVYTMRVNLSVALVAMVNATTDSKHERGSECPDLNTNSTDEHSSEGEFDWDESTQGNILGAFFYGYLVTQIPGGWLASRYGGKHVYGFGVLCTAVLTLLTPLAARFNLTALIVLRVLEGIGEGITFPAMHTMWGKWAPVLERSKLVAFSYAGSQVGTVIGMPISGILCDSDIMGGWPSVFYIFGALGCLWFILWMLVVHESPGQHPRISDKERDYIESSIGHKDHHQLKVPWKEIAKSPAVWAMNAANFANNWGVYTFLTCLPMFLKNILHFSVKDNGFLSALPYAVYWCAAVFAGFFADYLRQKGVMSTKLTRKVFNSIATLIPALLILGVGYVGCDYVLAVTFLTLCVGISGFTSAGFCVNHLDIAPTFAGILVAITNSFGTIPGFVSPILVGALTNHNQTRAQWQIVFYITSGIYLFGAMSFILFAQGDEQSWATTSMAVEIPDLEKTIEDAPVERKSTIQS